MRYKVLYGKHIKKEMFDKIIDLNCEVFDNSESDFDGEVAISRETLMSYLNKNIESTSIMYDSQQDKVIGFFWTLPFTKEFTKQYLNSEKSFMDITEDVIVNYESGKEYDLYFFSMGIQKELRGQKLVDSSSVINGQSVFKLLNEGFVEALTELKENKITINKVFAEAVSDKGNAICKNICRNKLIHKDEVNNFHLYLNNFYPKAFEKCRNYNKLEKAYKVAKVETFGD